MTITDRIRFTAIQCNTDEILARDLVAKNARFRVNLSASCDITFTMDKNEYVVSAAGIEWKAWSLWIVADLEINGVQKTFAVGILDDNTKVDKKTGELSVSATGYLTYPKGLPYLENFNPIAVDPYEVVQRIWAHIQSFSNANVGVNVVPASSGTQMLPGFSYDGNILNFMFFAVFYRAVDLNDCWDIISGLSRDIPFDMIEEPYWNADKTVLTKNVRLGYPQGGLQQNSLTFRVGENVLDAEKADEQTIEPVSDVIIRGWRPNQVMSSKLSNADPTRLRRTIIEEDAQIDSTERAAAWAKRKLTRRNIPPSFKTITIDPNHPNAPLGSFWVGDSIMIEAPHYSWYNEISGWHRVMYIDYDEGKGNCEVGVKVYGAFNWDPIQYDPNYINQPTADLNRLANGYFGDNLAGWVTLRGQWFRTTLKVYGTIYSSNSGSVRVDCDDAGEDFQSHVVGVTPGEKLRLQCVVMYQNFICPANVDGLQLLGITSINGDTTLGETFVVDKITGPSGNSGWNMLEMLEWTVPANINELRLQFHVDPQVGGGITWWTYARIVPSDSALVPA